jgi:prophage DNA circulation protein
MSFDAGFEPDPNADWKSRLQAASFKGVPFFTLDANYSFGRRLEVNEFPDRELPHSRDLGRAADRFSTTAFVVGPNYDLDRDKLIAALRSKGEGELVTERYGTHRVRIVGGSVKEEGKSGRFARIVFTAVEAGANRSPGITTDTIGKVKVAAVASQEGSLTSFLLKVDDGVGWVNDNVVATSEAALAIFDRGLELFQRSGPALKIAETSAALSSQIAAANGFQKAHSFAETGSGILDVAAAMAAVPESVAERLRVLEGMRHDGEDTIGAVLGKVFPRHASSTITPDEVIAETNREALGDLVRQGIVIGRGLVLIEAALASDEEVDELRDSFLGPIDAEIAIAGAGADDDAYIALREFRTAVLIDLAIRGEQAPEKADYTTPAPVSTLILASRLYADGSRATELEQTLAPHHPAFISGLKTIRVLRV